MTLLLSHDDMYLGIFYIKHNFNDTYLYMVQFVTQSENMKEKNIENQKLRGE